MADSKITELSEETSVLGTDLLLLVDDPGGTPASKKATVGNVVAGALGTIQLVNEVMNFPANVGIDIDLVATNQWWDSVATPSTAATMVDVAGEAGITETWEYALKCVADGSGDGLYQRYTYADQPRIKAGRILSAIGAVWVGTAGRTVTMSLTTSASTEVTATATAQGWTIIRAEGLTLDGSYVDLKVTVDGADTFYFVPLGVNIGPQAYALPPRGVRYIENNAYTMLVNNVDPGGGTWTDVDCTAGSSALCTMVNIDIGYQNGTAAGIAFAVRPNGNTTTPYVVTAQVIGVRCRARAVLAVDDGQIFEYDSGGDAGHAESLYINLVGWWEWV